jgi:small subunit ribosomal protein S15
MISMSLTTAQTAELLKKYGRRPGDTGSPEAQVALLTARLNYLNDHFKTNTKDHHSRTGLMKLVGQRRRLLDYLHRTNAESYRKLISDLGIRK